MWQKLKRWLAPASTIPETFRSTAWSRIPFLAVDLELTSLDASESEILSIGWVEGRDNQIPLQTCFYQVIRSQASLNQSPVIHGLLQADIEKGAPVRNSLAQLREFAQSHVWVFHNTSLDMAVLTKVYQRLEITLPTIVTLDTLKLALYQLAKSHDVPAPNAATLTSCRQRHNIPFAPAHNALDDAVATMELLFAQLRDFDPQGHEPFSALVASGAVRVFNAE